jgi:hypothetical protein
MKFPGRQRAVPAASHEPQREHVRRSGGAFGRPALLAGAACALAVTLTPVSAQQAERVDLTAIYKIKAEGLQRSRVMEITSWLTDVYGPRLTNSPGFRKAGEWAVKEMTSWGLVNVKLQPFGPFGRGWTNDKFYMMATTPGGSLPVIGYPQAWTSGTNGVAAGDAVFATIDSPEDITTWKGKLKGKFSCRPPCLTCRHSLTRRPSATRMTSCASSYARRSRRVEVDAADGALSAAVVEGRQRSR